jgi:hypothetical protein
MRRSLIISRLYIRWLLCDYNEARKRAGPEGSASLTGRLPEGARDALRGETFRQFVYKHVLMLLPMTGVTPLKITSDPAT